MGTKQAMTKFKEVRALRQFTLGKGKSAGRNSSGRITIFHRGGGSKRLQRRIDLKRTTSSIGIVERVEYDPNRSSWIAPVRWIEGVQMQQKKCNTIEEFDPPPLRKFFEPTTTAVSGKFSFSFLPRNVDQRKVASFSPGLMAADVNATVSIPSLKSPFTTTSDSKGAGGKSKITCAKDVFFSAFSSPMASGETASLSYPRIAVAGAKPTFFAPRMVEKVGGSDSSPDQRGKNTLSLCEIQKWRADSSFWAHRIKPKAALSWQGFRRQDHLGIVGAAEHNTSKPKTDRSLPAKPKDGACRVPVTYIIASHQLEAGKMVVNYDGSKPSTGNLLPSGQNAYLH